MKQTIGSIFIVAGIMVAAGSAGDCDGACMEVANTLSEMLMIAAAGVAAMLVGAAMVFSAQKD